MHWIRSKVHWLFPLTYLLVGLHLWFAFHHFGSAKVTQESVLQVMNELEVRAMNDWGVLLGVLRLITAIVSANALRQLKTSKLWGKELFLFAHVSFYLLSMLILGTGSAWLHFVGLHGAVLVLLALLFMGLVKVNPDGEG